MVRHKSGFERSEVDLKLRGPGDIFGKMQSGFPQLDFADLTVDKEILISAKNDAFSIVENDMELKKNGNYMIKRKLKEYYSENLKYSLIG
jgi:ATP-dependent DNA helicase RecG